VHRASGHLHLEVGAGTGRGGRRTRRPPEQFGDLLVGHRPEVVVPPAHGLERQRRMEADHIIGHLAQRTRSAGRCDRDGQDNP
jgi:hypothetical protein